MEKGEKPEVVSSLVFPNMVDETWANILRRKISDKPMFTEMRSYTWGLGDLVKSIAKFRWGNPLTENNVLDFFSKGKITETHNDFIETPSTGFYQKTPESSKQTTTWMSGVDAFIESCENNFFARDFLIIDLRKEELSSFHAITWRLNYVNCGGRV